MSQAWALRQQFGLSTSYRDLQKLVSTEVYPLVKGKRLTNQQLQDVIIPSLPFPSAPEPPAPSNYYNPTLIPLQDLAEIPWFGLDSYIRDTLGILVAPKDLRMQVYGGKFGNTGEFSLSNYVYQGSVSSIVEGVRDMVNNESSSTQFQAEVIVRPGRVDDGQPDSYQVAIVLYDEMGQPYEAVSSPVPPQPIPPELEAAREEMVRERKRIAGRKRQKQRREKIKAKMRAIELPKEVEKPKKKPAPSGLSMAKLRNQALAEQNKALAMLRKDYDDGIFTAKEYKAERNKLNARYEKILSKYSKGGEV